MSRDNDDESHKIWPIALRLESVLCAPIVADKSLGELVVKQEHENTISVEKGNELLGESAIVINQEGTVSSENTHDSPNEQAITRQEDTVSMKSDGGGGLQQTETSNDGMHSDQDLTSESPDQTTTTQEGKRSNLAKRPENDTTNRIHFVPPLDYHAAEIISDIQRGNWLFVIEHFQEASEMPTDIELLLPTPRDEIIRNLKRIIGCEQFFVPARNQLDEIWCSALCSDYKKARHLHPCAMSAAFRQWVVAEAGRRADIVLALRLALFCSDEERDLMTTEAVKRGQWRLVCLLIARGFASDRLLQWALEEAARNADRLEFKTFIYPCFTDDIDSDSVVKVLVEKGRFYCVASMLQLKLCHEDCHVWALTVASQLATKEELNSLIHEDHLKGYKLDRVLTELASRGMWNAVIQMLREDCVSDSQTRMKVLQRVWAQANIHVLNKIVKTCTFEELDYLLLEMMKQDMWHIVPKLLMRAKFFLDGTFNTDFDELHRRLYTDVSLRPRLLQFFDCSVIMSLLTEAIKQELSRLLDYLFVRESYYASKLKISSTLAFHETALQTCQSYPMLYAPFSSLSSVLDEMLTKVKMDIPDIESENWPDFVICLHGWTSVALTTHAQVHPELFNTWQTLLVQSLLERVAQAKNRIFMYEHLQMLLGMVPVIPLVQNVTVKLLATTDRWNYVDHVCWHFVQEEVRRYIFRKVVNCKQWGIVSQWPPHTLYEDERGWAMGRAMRDAQWPVLVTLAHHGLAQDEMNRVHRQIALHGDWQVVEEMVELGADVVPILQGLQEIARNRLQKVPEHQLTSRLDQLAGLRDRLVRDSQDFNLALWRCDWSAVLYKIRHTKTTAKELHQAMTAALQMGAWHVVEQLAKCGGICTDGGGGAIVGDVCGDGGGDGKRRRKRREQQQLQEQRDGLFQIALQEQQWSVVKTVVERGVSSHLCISALPYLLEAHEWLLVARMMEQPDLTDTCRREVLHHALEQGEGSLAAHCITCLHHPLTLPERQQVFERALKGGLCSLVNLLVQEQDSLGQTQREQALAVAVSRQQWSVIDCCFQLGAEVDPEQGNALAHLCARNGKWEQVEKLLYHGADPHIYYEKYTLLNWALWKGLFQPCAEHRYLKMLLEFHGDINRRDPDKETPLYLLIANGEADLIDTALLWGQNLTVDVSHDGDTVLHTVCRKGRWDTMRLLVARGCSPLGKSDERKTILCVATEDPQLAHKMVAECLKLGVGTFQPEVTDRYSKKKLTYNERTPFGVQTIEAASPFQRAALLGDTALMDMLYEAGACSRAELCRFSAALKKRKISPKSRVWKKAEELSVYVEHLATTPRSLLSCCRLVISHRLGVQWRREKRAMHLNQLDESMKKYVLFKT